MWGSYYAHRNSTPYLPSQSWPTKPGWQKHRYPLSVNPTWQLELFGQDACAQKFLCNKEDKNKQIKQFIWKQAEAVFIIFWKSQGRTYSYPLIVFARGKGEQAVICYIMIRMIMIWFVTKSHELPYCKLRPSTYQCPSNKTGRIFVPCYSAFLFFAPN